MSVTAIEKHLGKMTFMADVLDKINWRIVAPEKGMKIKLGCYRKSDKKIIPINKSL
jgi:hypothetical protein